MGKQQQDRTPRNGIRGWIRRGSRRRRHPRRRNGLGLGLAVLLTSGGDPTGGMLPMFFLPTRDVLLGLTLSIALGLLTGIFPARTAIKLRVADALRRM